MSDMGEKASPSMRYLARRTCPAIELYQYPSGRPHADGLAQPRCVVRCPTSRHSARPAASAFPIALRIGASTMNLLDILSPKAIKVPLVATEKKAVIGELVDVLTGAGFVKDGEALKQVVWQREQQRTTGIGEGLAIPHGKSASSPNLVMAIGRPAEPIDFDAIDKRPVRLVVLLVSPPEKTADHIQALGKLSRMMSDPSMRLAAYNAESANDLYQLFKTAEQG